MTDTFTLDPGRLTYTDLRRLAREPVRIDLNSNATQNIAHAHHTVLDAANGAHAVYGVNTGFGLLAKEKIDAGDLQALQRNLVLSHAAGVGAYLPDDIVRLILILKVNSLARGYSGVSHHLINTLLCFINGGVLPCIPAQGSVGASGDLAPLAHMAASLLGFGRVRIDGHEMDAAAGLARLNLEPLELGPKEGLALLNGTQVSTALALRHGLCLLDLLESALLTGALSLDALMGSDAPFDPRLHLVRGQKGQNHIAHALRTLLEGSAIRASHTGCARVQDPYSIRCQPQVMGAAMDFMHFAFRRLIIEANAVSDNPIVFADEGVIVSGGNFHAEPVALAADTMAIAAAEIGALAERRIALLIDPVLSGLPAFLVPHSGLNSGFMIGQVTAAALASENKHLAHPASVDSLPTSANQEDHVSMATFAARRLGSLADNVRRILAIEWLAAAQGVDFHAPLKTSAPLQRMMNALRAHVPFYEEDRFFANDIAQADDLIDAGTLTDIFERTLPGWPHP